MFCYFQQFNHGMAELTLFLVLPLNRRRCTRLLDLTLTSDAIPLT